MTERKILDVPEIIVEIEKAITLKGEDYVYSNPAYPNLTHVESVCNYVHGFGTENAEPGCIVGHVLHNLGMELEELHGMEGMPSNSLDLDSISLYLTSKASSLLRGVQILQDKGLPWGTALGEAMEGHYIS